jgi:hypothetical protein
VKSAAGLVFASALFSAAPLRAQNNEPIFRSWRWEEDALTPRAAGLGGAYVAVADDATAVFLNPAGLVSLATPGDLQIDLIRRPASELSTGDHLREKHNPAGSLGIRLGPRWGVGLAIRQKIEEIALGNDCYEEGCEPCIRLPDGTCEWANLRSSFTTYVLGAGYKPRFVRGLQLGVSLGVAQSTADGRSVRKAGGRDENWHDYSTDNHILSPHWVVGALWAVGPLQLGASYRGGEVWEFKREPASFGPPIPGRGPSGRQSYSFAAPARLSQGAALRLGHKQFRLLLAGELDYVRYDQIADAFDLEAGRTSYRRSDYRLSRAIERRLGLELAWRNMIKTNWRPLRGVGLQLRGGVYGSGRSSLRYEGPETSEQLVFSGPEPKTRWAVGVGLITGFPARLECTRLVGGYRDMWLFGLSVRYPGFF